MTYEKTLNYFYNQLPMFHRIGSAAYKADLNNTIAICDLIKNPQNNFKTIHVAGTNGKGSTSHILASILQEAGYKVGLYTSPHLKDFRERIKINGKMIPKKFVVDFAEKNKNEFEKIAPSFFEMTVGLTFDYFSKQKVDIAVIEVGLGGRLDSTNIITPILSVITNISYDHTNLLGNTLQKIAYEKAGIIKPGVPVVIGQTQSSIKNVFIDTAKKNKTSIEFADKRRQATGIRHQTGRLLLNIKRLKEVEYRNLKCGLTGLYQKKNILTVLCTAEELQRQGFNISKQNIYKGIEKVVRNTGLQGRWQVLNRKPLTIADTGHNEDGIKQILMQLKQMKYKTLHFVLGFVNDKDYEKILNMLPKKAVYYFCKANIPRALDENTLADTAAKYKLKGLPYPTVKKALRSAQKNAGKNDLVFVGGSTFVVADVL